MFNTEYQHSEGYNVRQHLNKLRRDFLRLKVNLQHIAKPEQQSAGNYVKGIISAEYCYYHGNISASRRHFTYKQVKLIQ